MIAVFVSSKITRFPNGWLAPVLMIAFGVASAFSARLALRERGFLTAGAFTGACITLTALGILSFLLVLQGGI
jgi:hypothetical protein